LLDIETVPTYNEDSTSATIRTTLKPVADIEGKLQIWVTESGIVSRQKNGSSFIKEYEHNHVYRASANSVGGENISLSANVFTTKEHTIAIKDEWNAKNLTVVAFVYNDNGVVQVAEQAIE
jgi:hypothetical protein